MNNYSFPESITISENAKSIITSILDLNPAKRPTLDQLLSHPFLFGIELEDLPLSALVVPYPNSKKGKEKSNSQDPQN